MGLGENFGVAGGVRVGAGPVTFHYSRDSSNVRARAGCRYAARGGIVGNELDRAVSLSLQRGV